MKTDRLIGILSVLLSKQQVTAPMLAKKFEVSRRTINRDIEDLCMAGIPIVTIQGAGGGIRIMEGYSMDRTLLTSRDMQMIMAGLRSLDSVSGSSYYQLLMERINPGYSEVIAGNESILIDLSSWSKEAISPKITLMLDAIEKRHLLAFDYYAPGGESKRVIHPYYLIFKWSSWYVYGYCENRRDNRMFKLNRMDRIRLLAEQFSEKAPQAPQLSVSELYPSVIGVKAILDPKYKWRLVEEYGLHCMEELADGRLLFRGNYSDMDSLLSWILTFGDGIELLEPVELKNRLYEIGKRFMETYKTKE